MKGLMKLCKQFGQITTGSNVWVWDYDKDMAVNAAMLKDEEIKRIKNSRNKYLKDQRAVCK